MTRRTIEEQQAEYLRAVPDEALKAYLYTKSGADELLRRYTALLQSRDGEIDGPYDGV